MKKVMPRAFISVMTILVISMYVSAQEEKTINNLIFPEDTKTVPIGTLGNVEKIGEGEVNLILIAGWGFSSDIFDEFVKRNMHQFTIHKITLAGFGETYPQQLPELGTSYGEQVWINGCISGIVEYINSKNLQNVTLIAYFNIATQIVLRINIEHADLIDKSIVIGGAPSMINPAIDPPPTLQQRIDINDSYFAPNWFKTVTKKMWNDGNFPREFYSLNNEVADIMWTEVASVPLPTMIQYLCEYNSQDISPKLEELKRPLLVLIPGYNLEILESTDPSLSFIKSNYIDPWANIDSDLLKSEVIKNSGNNILNDQFQISNRMINDFVKD